MRSATAWRFPEERAFNARHPGIESRRFLKGRYSVNASNKQTKAGDHRPKKGRKAKREKPAPEVIQTEALRNAVTRCSTMNYETIFEGFIEMGIDPDDIRPRENVFTFNAWKALGRVVRKGEHGVRCVTFIERKSGDAEGAADAPSTMEAAIAEQSEQGSKRLFSRPVTVFHVSQTDPLPDPAAQADSAPCPALLAPSSATVH